MIDEPFTLFKSFEDEMRVSIFTKEDGIASDTEAAERLGSKNIAGLSQVHGNRTVVVRSDNDRIEDADGLITDEAGLVLTVRWADCQNFIIYAPERHVVGLLHAGWRGLVSDCIPEYFEALRENFGIEPQETCVGAGPSLCKNCAEFSSPEKELPDVDPRFFDGRHVDLRALAKNSLLSLGVSEENFEASDDCTRCSPERYWTYRGGDSDEVKKGKINRLCCVLKK